MTADFNRAFQISDQEFAQVQKLILEWAGISLGPNKRPLVIGRLSKRLRHYQVSSFADYLARPLRENPGERQIMIDLLTTNETYFFREPAHFDYLAHHIVPNLTNRPLRIWSAACSTGAEPYTLAMVLSEALPDGDWSILATDINSSVLETAQSGLYDISAADKIPQRYRERYCLKGVRSKAGLMMIDPKLKSRISFQQFNLHTALDRLGSFDVIFLRNVMIYFNTDTKQRLIARMEQSLNPNGYLIVGHSESLHGLGRTLTMRKPSIYQKAPH